MITHALKAGDATRLYAAYVISVVPDPLAVLERCVASVESAVSCVAQSLSQRHSLSCKSRATVRRRQRIGWPQLNYYYRTARANAPAARINAQGQQTAHLDARSVPPGTLARFRISGSEPHELDAANQKRFCERKARSSAAMTRSRPNACSSHRK